MKKISKFGFFVLNPLGTRTVQALEFVFLLGGGDKCYIITLVVFCIWISHVFLFNTSVFYICSLMRVEVDVQCHSYM